MMALEWDDVNAHICQEMMDEMMRSSINRVAVYQGISRFQVGHHHRGDGAHTTLKGSGIITTFQQGQPLLKDLHIGIVDPRIDQAQVFVRLWIALAISQFEKPLTLFRIPENKGGCLEDRALYGTLAPMRIVAVRHH